MKWVYYSRHLLVKSQQQTNSTWSNHGALPIHFFSSFIQKKKLWIWLHLLKKSLMENFISCAMIWPISVNLYYSTIILQTIPFPIYLDELLKFPKQVYSPVKRNLKRIHHDFLIRFLNSKTWIGPFSENIYLFKVNNRNTRKRCETCSQLTIKHQNDVFDVVLVFLLLTLNIFHTFF